MRLPELILVAAFAAAGLWSGRASITTTTTTTATPKAATPNTTTKPATFSTVTASRPHKASAVELQVKSVPSPVDAGPEPEEEHAGRVWRMNALQREVHQMSGALMDRHRQVEIEGVPVEFPADRTPEAEGERVLALTNKSLQTRDINAEVEAIDCSEFPCIVHILFLGEGDRDQALLNLVDDATALGDGNPFGMSRPNHCSFAAYPQEMNVDRSPSHNVEKRMIMRAHAYLSSVQP